MPDPTPTPEREPTLTIDFVGLCAFVAHRAPNRPDTVDRVTVLLMDAEKAAPNDKLCRHDPLLLVRGKDLHETDGSEEDRFSSVFPPDQNIGLFGLQGKELRLDNVLPGSETPLELGKCYENIISLDRLTEKTAEVQGDWVNGTIKSGVASRLEITHGRLSGVKESGEWALDLPNGKPGSGWFTFQQIVRWEVFARPAGPQAYWMLRLGQDEWLEIKPSAHLVIGNLCPLGGQAPAVAPDILAFYAMAKDSVKPDQRLVLHPRNGGGAGGGSSARPGSEACPPVSGWV